MFEHVKKTAISHDGLNLYYETHNLQSGKPVIFFVHGAGGDADAWEFVRSQLLERGFGGISMDLRGHGYSAHPRNPKYYEIKNLTADIATILDQEKIDRVILIGHSYGAVVAIHFAIEYPERLNKLVIISGSHSSPNYLRHKPLKVLANWIIDLAAIVSPTSKANWHSQYPQGKFHKDYELFGLMRTIYHNSWGSYLLTSKQTLNLDIKFKLSKIKTPTLVIAGTSDSIFPHTVSTEIHGQIEGSKLELIDGANHVVILNHPKQTAKLIIDFLT